jgi:proline iminopeptidase
MAAGAPEVKVLRKHYDDIEPFEKSFLKVSDLHEIYFEQCGKKDGKPVLFLHGGPGGGVGPNDRKYFDPTVYRIILLDQRGAGNSKPSAELRENTTWDLVADIEKLRKHLSIDKWVVFGGSWGSTLSLVYAETHPSQVKALILRGIFTLRRKELIWYYQDGASRIFPDTWEKFIEPIPEVERHDLMSAYHRRLTGSDRALQMKCAQRWSAWEMATSRLYVDPELIKRADADEWAVQFARIESHYFVHGGFLKSETQILDDVPKIRHIPCTIVQGRYDLVCPADTAWELHKRWSEADFHLVADAGHSAKEEGIVSALVTAADKYKTL